MKEIEIVTVFTTDENKLYGGGVPFVICKNRKDMESYAMDLCNTIGATAHEIENHIFVIRR